MRRDPQPGSRRQAYGQYCLLPFSALTTPGATLLWIAMTAPSSRSARSLADSSLHPEICGFATVVLTAPVTVTISPSPNGLMLTGTLTVTVPVTVALQEKKRSQWTSTCPEPWAVAVNTPAARSRLAEVQFRAVAHPRPPPGHDCSQMLASGVDDWGRQRDRGSCAAALSRIGPDRSTQAFPQTA